MKRHYVWLINLAACFMLSSSMCAYLEVFVRPFVEMLEIYGINRMMSKQFILFAEDLCSLFSKVSFWLVQTADYEDARAVMQNLAKNTGISFLEFDVSKDIFWDNRRRFEEEFEQACSQSRLERKVVVLFFSNADCLVDADTVNHYKTGRWVSAFYEILNKYKNCANIRVVVHAQNLKQFVSEAEARIVHCVPLDLPCAYYRRRILDNVLKCENIVLDESLFELILQNTDGWTWTRLLSELQDLITSVQKCAADGATLTLRETRWDSLEKNCATTWFSMKKFVSGIRVADHKLALAVLCVCGGKKAFSLLKDKINLQRKKTGLSKELSNGSELSGKAFFQH